LSWIWLRGRDLRVPYSARVGPYISSLAILFFNHLLIAPHRFFVACCTILHIASGMDGICWAI
jgi:hypothetical protein